MDFNLTHSKAEETRFFAFSLEMLIGLCFFCKSAKSERIACRLCVGVEQLDSGLDGLSCLIGSALVVLALLSFRSGQTKSQRIGQGECVKQMRQIR